MLESGECLFFIQIMVFMVLNMMTWLNLDIVGLIQVWVLFKPLYDFKFFLWQHSRRRKVEVQDLYSTSIETGSGKLSLSLRGGGEISRASVGFCWYQFGWEK